MLFRSYLTDVLGDFPAVGQLGGILRTNVVALLNVEGLFVLQLMAPHQIKFTV